MSSDAFHTWQEHNREFLALAIDDLHARMEGEDTAALRARLEALLIEMSHEPGLLALAGRFDLDAFAQDLVLLCLAFEVDPRFRIDEHPVTVGYALEVLEGSNWAAVDASAPLRSWGLVELERAVTMTDARVRLAEDVARFLLGFDPREGGDEVFTLAPAPVLVESQRQGAVELAELITETAEAAGQVPAVELHGAAEEDRVALATMCANALGAVLATADVRDLPEPGQELDALLRTWGRIARLTSTMLCLTQPDRDDDPAIRHRIERALVRLRDVFFVCTGAPTTAEPARTVLRLRVEPLNADERLEVWEACAEASRNELIALANDFRFGARTIRRVCAESRGDLRGACARTVRARLDPLAERVRLQDVADVVLPVREAEQLLELERSVRLTKEVSEDWGLGHGRGGAATALFAGPSGTGKTHAALALARRLGLDLYRVDLASVLSKYIGETEKNLDRIFDAAEVGGTILLFDEADALFGKRSEVRDSHDRYANLGTAYLLSRVERTPTPTILTTNLKEAIDPAFLRRLHFVIDFPFPARGEREQIWRTIYPERAPVGELEPGKLAAVSATGGTIRNIARRGAFLAAAEGEEIEMEHLREATVRELRTAGRDLTPEELRAWPRSE
ncbi:ATP-binding protein [Solirubrobacter soli]|uniref:ATP-binding protein n=1 Tax=Solirubrobacter soli TaxID=363832 RepID=UPI0004009CCC|nr:ATP-binding protein [Solirubrobacter soli]